MNFKILGPEGILVLEPNHPLEAADFLAISHDVDDYLSTHAKLKGVLIHTKFFPGWHDFSGFMAHMRFVRGHHRFVEKIALVTDAAIADAAKAIVGHFIHAEIKHFQYADDEQALSWLQKSSAS